MKKLNINRKGFTLVELLAVIVILAILMVAAGTAIMSTINNAKVNTFKNEALTYLDNAKLLNSDLSGDPHNEGNNIIVKSSDSNYKGMCVTLRGLSENGYLEKDLNNNLIRGVILVETAISGGSTKYSIWLSDGTYGIDGYERNSITSLKSKKENNTTGKGIITDTTTKIDPDLRGPYGLSASGDFKDSSAEQSKITIKSPDAANGGTGLTYTNIQCINGRLS